MQVPQEARGIGTPEAVVTGGCKPWVLGTELGSSAKAKWPLSQSLYPVFFAFEIRSNHDSPPASAS